VLGNLLGLKALSSLLSSLVSGSLGLLSLLEGGSLVLEGFLMSLLLLLLSSLLLLGLSAGLSLKPGHLGLGLLLSISSEVLPVMSILLSLSLLLLSSGSSLLGDSRLSFLPLNLLFKILSSVESMLSLLLSFLEGLLGSSSLLPGGSHVSLGLGKLLSLLGLEESILGGLLCLLPLISLLLESSSLFLFRFLLSSKRIFGSVSLSSQSISLLVGSLSGLFGGFDLLLAVGSFLSLLGLTLGASLGTLSFLLGHSSFIGAFLSLNSLSDLGFHGSLESLSLGPLGFGFGGLLSGFHLLSSLSLGGFLGKAVGLLSSSELLIGLLLLDSLALLLSGQLSSFGISSSLLLSKGSRNGGLDGGLSLSFGLLEGSLLSGGILQCLSILLSLVSSGLLSSSFSLLSLRFLGLLGSLGLLLGLLSISSGQGSGSILLSLGLGSISFSLGLLLGLFVGSGISLLLSSRESGSLGSFDLGSVNLGLGSRSSFSCLLLVLDTPPVLLDILSFLDSVQFLIFITVASLVFPRDGVHIFEVLGRASDVRGLVRVVHGEVAFGHRVEVLGHLSLSGFSVLRAEEHPTITHAVAALVTAVSGHVLGFGLTPALLALSRPGVGAELTSIAVGPVGGLLAEGLPVPQLFEGGNSLVCVGSIQSTVPESTSALAGGQVGVTAEPRLLPALVLCQGTVSGLESLLGEVIPGEFLGVGALLTEFMLERGASIKIFLGLNSSQVLAALGVPALKQSD